MIARSLTTPRGPPLSPHVREMERIRASATVSVVGALGRKARRLPRGLRSPRSFPDNGAASVHLAQHGQPIENLPFSTHSLPLHSADFNVHFSIATRKRRREGQNGPAISGVYTHTAVLSQIDSRPRSLRLARFLCPRARSYVFISRMFLSRRLGASCSIPSCLKFNPRSRASRYNVDLVSSCYLAIEVIK